MKKLHEIIQTLETIDITLSIEEVQPYAKSINIYINEYLMSPAIFVPTIVTNAICGGFITSKSNMLDDIIHYLTEQDIEIDSEEWNNEYELLISQAFPITNLIK